MLLESAVRSSFEGECMFEGQSSDLGCSSMADCPSDAGWTCEEWVTYPPYTTDGRAARTTVRAIPM